MPPNGLQVYYYSDNIIGLEWNRSFTLFDNTENAPTLRYIVYGYFNDSVTYSGQDEYFYKNETTLLMHEIFTNHLHVRPCGPYTVSFSVSAKFDEVGEGNMTDPEKITILPEKSTKTCEYNNRHVRHTSFHVVLGITIGASSLIVALIVITCFIVAICIIIRLQTVTKVVTDSEDNQSSISTDNEDALKISYYETVDELTSTEIQLSVVKMNPLSSSVYETIHEVISREDDVKMDPNCTYNTGKVASRDDGMKVDPNCAHETSTIDKVASRDEDVKMDPNCAYVTTRKATSRDDGVRMDPNCAYGTANDNVMHITCTDSHVHSLKV